MKSGSATPNVILVAITLFRVVVATTAIVVAGTMPRLGLKLVPALRTMALWWWESTQGEDRAARHRAFSDLIDIAAALTA